MLKIITKKNAAVLDTLTYSDVFSGKVKTLYNAYGFGNDFCTFYEQTYDNKPVLILSKLDRDFTVKILPETNTAAFTSEAAEELAEFVRASNGHTLFIDGTAGAVLERYLRGRQLHNHIMLYEKAADYNSSGKLRETTDYRRVYEIIKSYFNPDYNVWHTDISHRVTGGISKVYIYNNSSVATVLYTGGGTAFITQVATAEAEQGKGNASEMMKEICSRYMNGGLKCCLVCRDDTMAFYEKIGFRRTGGCVQYYNIRTILTPQETAVSKPTKT